MSRMLSTCKTSLKGSDSNRVGAAQALRVDTFGFRCPLPCPQHRAVRSLGAAFSFRDANHGGSLPAVVDQERAPQEVSVYPFSVGSPAPIQPFHPPSIDSTFV